MKRLLLVLIAALFTGCTVKGFYTVVLENVEHPQNKNVRFGDTVVNKSLEEGTTSYGYTDSLITIVWQVFDTQFGFNLANNTNHSLKIIWDDAVYIDVDGQSKRVMHSGVKFIDRNNPQPPTVVARGSTINDMILPTDNVYFVSGQYGGWHEHPLFYNSAPTQDELTKLSALYVGKSVRVLLPIEIEGTVNEYTFTFKIEDFTKNEPHNEVFD